MATKHNDHHSKAAHKYVNPVSVPKKKKKKIKKSDPRNNKHFLENSDEDYDIDDSPELTEEIESDDIGSSFDETYDPDTHLNTGFETAIPTPAETSEDLTVTQLNSPENLSIDANSYQLADTNASSDGIIRFIASLYFDDVDGAQDYEYVLNAKG